MGRRPTSRRLRLTVGFAFAGLLVPLAGAPAGSQPDFGHAGAPKAASGVYIVHLADPPAGAYRGGRVGLAPTQPSPAAKLDRGQPDVARYAQFLDARHAQALAAAGAAPEARFYDYRYSFNGFAADLTPTQAARLRARSDVVSVTQDQLSHVQTDNTPAFLGLSGPGGLWSQAGGQGAAGENVIVGVVDTGAWPEHPSFSDQADLGDRPGHSGDAQRVYGPPPASWHGVCQSGQNWSQDDCNNKLIGARYFLDGFTRRAVIKADYRSARDADGHGSHTSSTAAGNAGVNPSILGNDLGVTTISGMAPRARIAVYKACWNGETGGCTESDLVAAIDAAVADGVDVINYSIGSDTPSLLSPDAVSFLFAAAAGVFVSASAGNAGPGPGTVGAPASAPWVTAAAASTQDRTFEARLTLGDGRVFKGASVTQGVGNLTLVDAADAGSELCIDGRLDPAKVAGKMVLCKRGDNARVEKSKAVADAGGAAMVLYNAVEPQSTLTDNHFVPAVHITNGDGLAVKAYIHAATNPTGRLSKGTAVADPTAPLMADFSSRGPNGASGDVLKPDVTAPGVNILAGNSPTPMLSAPGQLFQSISGTSMSSPHVAGVAALLVQLHRNWTPAMIRSALETTARQGVKKEDGVTPADPFDFGAGHINPTPASDPGLVYDAGFGDYVAFLCGAGALATSTCTGTFGVTPIDPSDLNLPSISIGSLAGIQTVTRRVTNVGPAGTYTASVQAPPGVSVVVSPPSITLAAGASAGFTVTFTSQATASLDHWSFGALTWNGGGHAVRSPLVVRPVALAAPGEVAGTGVTGSTTWNVQPGYSGPLAADVHGLVPAVTEQATVADDPANDIGTALTTGVGVHLHAVAVPAGTHHLRASLFDGFTDGHDDLDLYLFDPNGNLVDASGGPTAAETVNAEHPVPGTWTVVVHGFQTDGPDATYTLFRWLLPATPAGNMTVSAPATAVLGAPAPVTASWSGLSPSTKYLGCVTYRRGTTTVGQTMVAVST